MSTRFLAILLTLTMPVSALAQTAGTKEAAQMQGLSAPKVLLPDSPPPPRQVPTDHTWKEKNAIAALYTGLGLTVLASVAGGLYSGYSLDSKPAGIFVGSFGAVTGLTSTLIFSTHVGHDSHLQWASGLSVAVSLALPFLLGFSLQ